MKKPGRKSLTLLAQCSITTKVRALRTCTVYNIILNTTSQVKAKQNHNSCFAKRLIRWQLIQIKSIESIYLNELPLDEPLDETAVVVLFCVYLTCSV